MTTSFSLTRREFLYRAGIGIAGATGLPAVEARVLASPELHPAAFYTTLDRNAIQCGLCPWNCIVQEGKRGRCGVRENRSGHYYSLVYGRPVTMHNDPIQKKPLFHVYPGSTAFSIATVGCNISCKFCQNYGISQKNPDTITPRFIGPDTIAQTAETKKSRTIAYTYNEPTIFYEYMRDCAKAARDRGIGNLMISNGFISKQPLKELLPLMTAIKIDFKAFSQTFYENTCSGRLKPVLRTLKQVADSNVWLEIVILVIPTLNDSMNDIQRMSAWIVKELGPDIPLHFTRFRPEYQLRNIPPTPLKTIEKARATARSEGCSFVYAGNMPGQEGENTYCPTCQTLLINRYGFTVISNKLKRSACGKCGTRIPGVWE